MDTREALEALMGKRGLLKIAGNGEIGFTYLSVEPPDQFPAETDLMAFNDVVSQCYFRVRFDEHVVDGSQIGRISGYNISRLEW